LTDTIKIVYLIGQLGLGGSERQLYLLLKHFDREQFDVTVIVFNPSPNVVLNQALESLGVRVVVVPESFTSIRQRVRYLFRKFREIRPDILHSWTAHDNAYAGVVGWLAGVPIRWGSIRGSIRHEGFQSLPGLFQWLSLWTVSRLIVNAQSIRDELRDLGQLTNRVEVLPNCTEIFPASDLPDLSDLGIYPLHRLVGIVGNIRQVKNHTMFVEGMIRVLPHFPDTKALVIGHPIPGHENLAEKLKARIQSAGMADQIFYTGFREDIPALMHRFSIFCLTSESEGTPNVILEAMAAGCPVVATRVGGVPDIVQHRVNGLLVEPGNVDEFAHAVRTLLENPSLAAQWGHTGQEMVKKMYGCKLAVQKLTGLYVQALEESGIKKRPGVAR
jgi:glycosyltransferase involved in cell wall biosynthesis